MKQRRNVLVIGGGGGIGAACCRHLSADWVPVVADVNENAAAEVAGEVDGHAVRMNVADEAGCESVIDDIERRLGPLEALIFAAGIVPPPMDPHAATLAEWDRVFDVNARGAYACTRLVGNRMARRGRGSIVLIASLAGICSTPHTIYGPSKAAMINLASSLAVYWGRDGVRVNSVSPGPVRTPLIEESYRRGERDPQEMARHTALGRVIRPEEVAAPIGFLLSDAASAITGANLLIDAGMYAALTWSMFGGVEKIRSLGNPT